MKPYYKTFYFVSLALIFTIASLHAYASPPIRQIGVHSLQEGSRDVILDGTLALTVAWTHNNPKVVVSFFDTTDPKKPTRIGEYLSDGLGSRAIELQPAFEMDIDNNVLYLPVEGGFDIVDIINPANPRLLSTYRNENLELVLGGICQAQDTIVLFTHGFGDRVEVIDVSDPHNPKQLGEATVLNEIRKVVWNGGNTAYLLLYNARNIDSGHGIAVLDFSNTQQPNVTRFVPLPVVPVTYVYLNLPGMTIWNNRLFVSSYKLGWHVLSIEDPTAPVLLETLESPKSDYDEGDYDLVHNDTYLFTVCYYNASIKSFGIKEGKPVSLGRTGNAFRALAINNDILAAINSIAGVPSLTLFQIQPPSSVNPYQYYR